MCDPGGSTHGEAYDVMSTITMATDETNYVNFHDVRSDSSSYVNHRDIAHD